MTKAQAQARINKLRNEIARHRYLYHVKDTQEISDAALDSLKAELQQLESEFPDLITADSPTQRVGGEPLPQFEQVEHSTRMLSLQDVFSLDELSEWNQRNQKIVPGQYEFFVELKIDGVAVALQYEDGQLVRAATRGDGRVGEDVTHAIRTIEAIPLRLAEHVDGTVEVRGEVYMRKDDFARLNKERKQNDEELYANPRNVAAGSIRQLDPAAAAARPLRFFAWEITRGVTLDTRQKEYDRLQELGFAVPPDALLVPSLKEAHSFLTKEDKRREKRPFLVDGAVLKINDLTVASRLGVVGKAPRASVAYKFAAEEATTKVEDIVVQVGRTGALTPVAHLAPVQVAGTTVSRATLHNADEIARKDVRVGDTVVIRKAGDIIPEVVQVLTRMRPQNAKRFAMPRKCPMCGSTVTKDKDAVVHRCTNSECFPVQRERIIHAVSRAAFDIEGLGDKVVEQLLQEGLIEEVPDLWELTAGDLTPLERFAEKSAQNLVDELARKKNISLTRFIIALGIPTVGAITAQDLASEFKSLPRLVSATADQLEEVEGVGGVVAAEIADWLASERGKRVLARYKEVGVTVQAHSGGGPLTGKTFLFTGTLPDITRDEAKQRVQNLGGKVASSVGASVDYVVIGEEAGSKEEKARALGLNCITVKEFQKLVGQGG